MILKLSITVFLTQLIFIGCRTWNVKAISNKDLKGVLLSGAFVHISWLVSIAIGVTSMVSVVQNFDLSYLPVIFSSLSGGLLGSYFGMKNKLNKK